MIMCGILIIKIGSLAWLVVFDFRMGRVRYLKKGSGTMTGQVVRQFLRRQTYARVVFYIIDISFTFCETAIL